jgi:hypothetical protein
MRCTTDPRVDAHIDALPAARLIPQQDPSLQVKGHFCVHGTRAAVVGVRPLR